MTNPWVRRLGVFFTVLLLAAGLVLPQISLIRAGLVPFFVSYGLIAIAALIAFFTVRSNSRGDLLCLYASALFLGYIVIRALTSPVPYFARPDLYSVLAALALYGVTVTALSSSARRIALIIALLGFAVLHVLVSLVQFGLGENFTLIHSLQKVVGMQRASGLYLNPDHLAGLLEVLGILGLSITCWSRWPNWARVIFGYLTAMCYIGVAMTGSRGGYLSAAASLIVFAVLGLILLWSAGATFLLKFGLGGLVAIAVAFIAAGSLIKGNPQVSGHVGDIAATDHGRLALWRASIEQWKLQPLTGTGSGTYRFYGRQFRAERMQDDPVYVHNDYLQLLCEYGLIGLAGFLLFLFAHLRHGWRTFVRLGPKRIDAGSSLLSDRLALNVGALCAIAAYLVHSVFDFNLHIPANALLLAFVFGIVANPGLDTKSDVAPSRSNTVSGLVTVALAVILLVQVPRLLPGEHYAARAAAALESADPIAAISFARQALRYERQNPVVFFWLGRGLVARGDEKGQAEARTASYEEALAAFGEGYRLAPLDETYPLNLAWTYDSLGRFAEAEWMYGIARSLDPRSRAVAHLYQAHLRLWEDNVEEK